MNAETQAAILAIPQQPQRQDGILDQLHDLRVAANKLGLYDAADLLRGMLDSKQNQPTPS
ncbi:hypothetical protein PVE_R2G0562 [Pseudomonas veronii 1YdBTEX2]|uniref:Uncharacterized protein n=1 Tax=Pseudomonas veronii 1YdBTEX2 TaxID=1295141 RepID=A0A1D3K8F1_PSEVE|nr:hypothetical protein [Pseudomonas sp. AP19]OEC64327.1 hypothetical protein A7D21_33545 [Pseudomonas sp. AP19]SBW84588.1 hypothetical protein PVE_R2G0562 [Pseudomonas veronii 1YdBTEX2]